MNHALGDDSFRLLQQSAYPPGSASREEGASWARSYLLNVPCGLNGVKVTFGPDGGRNRVLSCGDMNVMDSLIIAATTFLASGVEAIEALTIVLAIGQARSWTLALRGTCIALLLLVAIVALGGPLLHTLPLYLLRLVIGIVVVLFGLEWLRKAILRSLGRISMHDEDAIFARELVAVQNAREDRMLLTTVFQAVFLEGLEVVVIVLGFGSASASALGWAAGGALAAVAVVVSLGIALLRPISQIPENTIKYVVGIMLTSFGTFWLGEGLGIIWWPADLAFLGILLGYAGVGYAAQRYRVHPNDHATRNAVQTFSRLFMRSSTVQSMDMLSRSWRFLAGESRVMPMVALGAIGITAFFVHVLNLTGDSVGILLWIMMVCALTLGLIEGNLP